MEVKEVPKPRKTRKSDWLVSVNAVDTTERQIKSSEKIDVLCSSCRNVTVSIRVSNIESNIKNRGYSARCRSCFKESASQQASQRTGENNPFFGKTHSLETKQKISEKKQKEMKSLDKSEINKKCAKMRKAAYEKYGGNPMHNEEVRKRQLASTQTSEFIEKVKKRSRHLSGDKEFSESMRRISKSFWNSDNGNINKGKQSKRIKEIIWNNADYRIARENGHKRYIQDSSRISAMVEKSQLTCLEKYGELNWQQSDAAAKSGKTFVSKGELEIFDWVWSFGFSPEKMRKFGHEIDIFIPELNIGIEYNGLYWHSEINKHKQYHLEKTNFFKKHNIEIIHIFEHEWRDRQHQVKSFLLSKIGKNNERYYARKVDFRFIEPSEVKDFINENHIQGHSLRSKWAIAGFVDSVMVVAATFAYHHRNNQDLVLNRFAGKYGVSVVGGLSKISKMFYQRFEVPIISWCDLRWSSGSGYIKAGWKGEQVLHPDYFYTNGRNVIPKQSRKKSVVGTPTGMTEHEHALQDGLFRVWDCGKIRMIYPAK